MISLSRSALPFFALASTLLSVPVHAATLVGSWNFSNPANIGQATVGSNLTVVGAAPTYSATQSDGTTTLSGTIATVGGTANRLVMLNTVGGNGGGAFTNEYSFLFDIYSPLASRSSWRALIQTNTANSNDADYFIRNSDDRIGISSPLGYSTNPINDSVWTRLMLTFDINAAGNTSFVRAYVNGSLFHTHSFSGGLDGTYGLESSVILFGDNNNENASLNVGAVAYWDGTLSASEVSSLGTVGTAIPEPGRAATLLSGGRARYSPPSSLIIA